jgi:anhydro-N-acetylmuramic acid kinase
MALYIGLMSGTSMDGIDAALVEMPSNTLIYGNTTKYPDEVKSRIDSIISGNPISLSAICQLNTLIGREFAKATINVLKNAELTPQDISAIGSHGQTVCHDTRSNIPYTLQLGCAHTISSYTGISVVADFRTRDIVHGGQGAPFAPLYHQELLSPIEERVAVVNIGGISNISVIDPIQKTVGWDIGPGNCLMDAWIHQCQGVFFDSEGSWARQGEIIAPLLDHLLSDPFLASGSPKSIGKEYFSLLWLESYLKTGYKPVDIQATLVALTANSIADAINQQKNINRLYLCGGGAHNTYLHQQIAAFLPEVSVQSIAALGINPDFLEAMMFAWLAQQTMMNNPVDLTTITGSTGPAILGAIYPANKIANRSDQLQNI